MRPSRLAQRKGGDVPGSGVLDTVIRTPIPTTGGQMKRLLLFAATCALALFVAAPSFAATGVTLFGTATQEASDVKIVSDFSDAVTTNDSGGVDIAVATGTTFSSLTALSAQFQLQTGDCGGGSPRFQINVDGKNVFVYLGPSPSFTGCAAATWIDSGNLVGTSDACRVDTSQLAGGKVCSTWAEAVTLLGSHTVTGIQFAVDGGWKQTGKVQTVLVRSITVNGTTYNLAQETTPPPDRRQGESREVLQGAEGHDGLGGLQRALGDEHEREERLRQVREHRRACAERRQDRAADHRRGDRVRREGPEGRPARLVRCSTRRRCRDEDRGAGAQGCAGGLQEEGARQERTKKGHGKKK